MLALASIVYHQRATVMTILDNILVTLLEAPRRYIKLGSPTAFLLIQGVPFGSHQAVLAIYVGA
jgi:hypothetical protein